MSDNRQKLIEALKAGGHMTRSSTERNDGGSYGEDASIALAEGDKITCVAEPDKDFDIYGSPGDVFVLGPSQFPSGTLFSGGHGRGFTLLTPEGKWKLNTFAGTIMKFIKSGKFAYEPGPGKPVA